MYSTSYSYQPNDPKRIMKAKETVRKTYYLLSLMSLLATLGVYFQLRFRLYFPVFQFLGIVFLGIFLIQRLSNASTKWKIISLTIFSLCEGISLGPLVYNTLEIDPRIVFFALGGTLVIFLSFTVAAHIGEDNFLIYGGALSSMLSLMCFLGFINIFFGFRWIFVFQIYGGLLIFMFYILYDTQKMIAKANRGEDDYCEFAVALFLDLVAIFVRLLVILRKMNEKKEKKKKRRK